jgi:ubiquinone/menaquinone biosynthesis C-methylase UbiE
MIKLIDLTRRILAKHIDSKTGAVEVILLGYCNNETASEHISRYMLASRFAYGVVLDCAAGSCYGSSTLRRSESVELVVSVDIDKDLLQYGKIVYNADCVCADATHLPFKSGSFDTIVSIETLEHIKKSGAFLDEIKYCLKKGKDLILSTPNKFYTSPFLPKPLNPYHANEYYLGLLLAFLKSHGFKPTRIYGGRKTTSLELIRRIFGSLLKFLLAKLSLKSYLIDDLYQILNPIRQKRETIKSVDPDPSLFTHAELKATSNMTSYQYFLIYAHRS